MATTYNEAPTNPNNTLLDYRINGPLAGVLAMQNQGIFEDNQARQARDSDLNFAQNNLKYQEDVKDIPLKDAERTNKIDAAGIVKQLRDSGLVTQDEIGKVTASIAKSAADVDKSKMSQAVDKAVLTGSAMEGLPKDYEDTPVYRAKYEVVRQQLAPFMQLPEVPDATTHTKLRSLAAMSAGVIQHGYSMEALKYKGENELAVQRLRNEGSYAAASVAAGLKGTEFDQDVRSFKEALNTGKPVDSKDLPRLVNAYSRSLESKEEKDTIDKREKDLLPKLEGLYQTGKGDPKSTSYKEYAQRAADVGLPATVQPEKIARAEAMKEHNDKIKQAIVGTFGNLRLQLEDGSEITVAEVAKQGILDRLIGGSGTTTRPVNTQSATPAKAVATGQVTKIGNADYEVLTDPKTGQKANYRVGSEPWKALKAAQASAPPPAAPSPTSSGATGSFDSSNSATPFAGLASGIADAWNYSTRKKQGQ